MGITVKTEEQIRSEQGRVTRDGVYTLGRNRFRIQAGDVLPDGAVLDAVPAEEAEPEIESDAPEQRMQPAAPENRALQGAPTNRRKAKKDGE